MLPSFLVLLPYSLPSKHSFSTRHKHITFQINAKHQPKQIAASSTFLRAGKAAKYLTFQRISSWVIFKVWINKDCWDRVWGWGGERVKEIIGASAKVWNMLWPGIKLWEKNPAFMSSNRGSIYWFSPPPQPLLNPLLLVKSVLERKR